MRSWSDLERLFTSLATAQGERLDIQWGQSGEHWMIAAAPSPLWRQRFRAAARMAGNRILLTDASLLPVDIANEPDAETRWYRALKAFAANYSPEMPGQVFGENNEPLGYIYPGRIPDVANASASVCLHIDSLLVAHAPQRAPETSEAVQHLSANSDTLELRIWPDIHPEILSVARDRYEAGFFADAVEASLKHLVSQLKTRLGERLAEDFDGSALMKRVFSPDRPLLVLGDRATQTGRALQVGYMEIFAGTMTGIRNPKAHGNVSIDARRCRHFLYLASLLMQKIDEAGDSRES